MPPQRLPLLDRASSSSDSVCDDEEEELLQLSSSDSSTGPSPVIPKLTLNSGHDGADEISKDLAELEELRKSVQKNLRLRPIRSRGRLPRVDIDEMGVRMPGAFPLSAKLKEELAVESPTSSVNTPTSAVGPGIVLAAVPALAYANNAQVSATVTDKMTKDGGAVDGMASRTVSGNSTNMGASTGSNATTTTFSTNSTPTKLKLKPKNKSKGPPPALVLQGSNTHNSNSITTSTQPPHIQFGTDDPHEAEIIVPPRPPFAQLSLGLTVDTPISATSPTSSIVSSYFTPVGDTPITSRFVGEYYGSPSGSDGESSSAATTITALTPTEPSSTPPNSFNTSTVSTPDPTTITQTTNLASDKPQPIPASKLYARLFQGSAVSKGRPRPLVIDTRAPAAHVAYRIRGSINIAIPSLILKRCRKMTASGIVRGAPDANPSLNSNAPLTGGGKGGFQNMEALRQFVVGEKAKEEWSVMLKSLDRSHSEDEESGFVWDGDVIVYDEEMGPDVTGTAWILMEVLTPLVNRHGGRVDYLEGGIMKCVKDTELEKLVEFGPMVSSAEEPTAVGGKKFPTSGLSQLDTNKKLSNIEASSSLSSASTLSSNPTSPGLSSAPRSPMFIHPPPLASANTSSSDINNDTTAATSIPVHVMSDASHGLDSAPSPPPSSLTFRHHTLSLPIGGGLRPKRPSVPNLRRIDTKSAERLNPNLPKLSVKTKPVRSATLTIPPRLVMPDLNHGGLQPTSPSHLNLVYSSHSPPASSRHNAGFGDGGNGSFGLTPYYTPPHTPGTPKAFSSLQSSFGGPMSAHPDSQGGYHLQFLGSGSGSWNSMTDSEREKERGYPPSPSTARPEPPSTESEAIPSFTISTILPGFLFLGPELTEPGHVEELKELGVKRILNLAIECNEDDHGLKLTKRFDRYVKISMRDTVEEENVLKGVRQVCEILDDARLHSAPTYVHCKAGKSRSVTAVMAYLIHANHWTLSRAYAFVLERRKGISPNIGFVSELMNFEEQELGGKSVGVQPPSDHSENGNGGGEELAFAGMGLRRGGHVRESLPPLESISSAAAAGAFGGDNFGNNTSHIGPMSAGGVQLQRVLVGDQAQETEVKDASGRYRHARRAPVDETTLQPLRRVSKAGLESSIFEELPRGEREREKGRAVE